MIRSLNSQKINRHYFAAGFDDIEANVQQGTQSDAQWLSYSANKTHGLYRSNEDKQRAVIAALAHVKSRNLSDAAIAKHCGVSDRMIAKYRTPKVSQSPSRTGRDGRTINTSNIGKTKPSKSASKSVQVSREIIDNRTGVLIA